MYLGTVAELSLHIKLTVVSDRNQGLSLAKIHSLPSFYNLLLVVIVAAVDIILAVVLFKILVSNKDILDKGSDGPLFDHRPILKLIAIIIR